MKPLPRKGQRWLRKAGVWERTIIEILEDRHSLYWTKAIVIQSTLFQISEIGRWNLTEDYYSYLDGQDKPEL